LSNYSAKSWNEQVTFSRDDVCFVLVLAHWNNSPRVDMSLHSDTLSWMRATYYIPRVDMSFHSDTLSWMRATHYMFLLIYWWLLSNVVTNANCMVISFDPTRFWNHKLPQLKQAGLFDKCRREILWCYRLLSLTSMIKTYFIEIKDHTNSRSMTYFFIYE
jgi:hypothetical protein